MMMWNDDLSYDSKKWSRFLSVTYSFNDVVAAAVVVVDLGLQMLNDDSEQLILLFVYLFFPGKPAGKHVVIVDDLVQTGGTLRECAKVNLCWSE